MDDLKTFYKIINEICGEKNIEQKFLSYGWIRQLKKENEIHHIIKYQFDLNSANAYKIAKDKYATFAVLHENNIPMIEHFMMFNPNTRYNYCDIDYKTKIKQILEKENKIVIKANDSSQGKDVYLAVDEAEATNVINKIFNTDNKDSISLCPYVEIDYEYRVIVLDNEVLHVYKKRKPYVIGDGISTIEELVKEKYKEDIVLDNDLDLNKILKFEEEVNVSWKHNLSNGAEPIIVTEDDEYLKSIKDIAIKAANAIGIRFATVDIALTNKKELSVVEVNGSVCMNKFSELIPKGYDIAKEIYSKAIDKMFRKI